MVKAAEPYEDRVSRPGDGGGHMGTLRPQQASSHEIRRFTVVSRRFSGGWRRPDPPSRWDMASGDGTFSIKGGWGGWVTYHGDRRGGGGMDSYPPDPRWGRGSSAVEMCAGVPGHGRVSSEWQWRDIRCTPAQYRDALARLDLTQVAAGLPKSVLRRGERRVRRPIGQPAPQLRAKNQ
jgi:hypothetical protein